jgi:Lrp/AsnC family leucine-responsive transcriptional regulator
MHIQMTDDFSVDATDHAIIGELRKDGRATNQNIAVKLGMTAATVSTRIRRLEDANKLRVVAVSDFSAHGYNFIMQVAVEVEGRPASDVALELAEFPEVLAVHLVTGRYDIDMLVALHDVDELPQTIFHKFGEVKGIRSLMPAIVVEIMKYKFDIAPIDNGMAA